MFERNYRHDGGYDDVGVVFVVVVVVVVVGSRI